MSVVWFRECQMVCKHRQSTVTLSNCATTAQARQLGPFQGTMLSEGSRGSGLSRSRKATLTERIFLPISIRFTPSPNSAVGNLGSGHPDVTQAAAKARGERVAPWRSRKIGRTDWMGCTV